MISTPTGYMKSYLKLYLLKKNYSSTIYDNKKSFIPIFIQQIFVEHLQCVKKFTGWKTPFLNKSIRQKLFTIIKCYKCYDRYIIVSTQRGKLERRWILNLTLVV
jgi:hypothetical protein